MSEKRAVKIPESVLQGVNDADNVVLFTHVHPDGDALGSSLGFAEILEGLGKRVLFYLEEPVGQLYSFLPGVERVTTKVEQVHQFVQQSTGKTIALALDSGDDSRLGRNKDEFLQITPFLVIDHHKSHRNYGEHRWVSATMSSTGEMLYELARKLGGPITKTAAVNLYVAICTDTGSFRYENTSARTLEIASELVALGVRPEETAKCLYENISLPRIRLLQRVLGTLEIHEGGRLAVIHVTTKMIEECGAVPEDIEGFVDYPRSLNSVKVAAFIKEAAGGRISVSLRAKGECDVAVIANRFNGGGHRNAAGFRFDDHTLQEVKTIVLAELGSCVRSLT